MPGRGNLASAHGSMNHLAFDVPLDKFEEYRQRLIDEGVDVSDILDHDDSELTVAQFPSWRVCAVVLLFRSRWHSSRICFMDSRDGHRSRCGDRPGHRRWNESFSLIHSVSPKAEPGTPN